MSPTIALFSIFGYVFAFHYIFRRHLEFLIIVSISFITSVLYLCGFLGILYPGAVVLFYLGICLFVGFIPVFLYEKFPITKFINPGILFFIASGIIFWWLFHDTTYFFWDEFSHWGLATKEMMYRHKFHDQFSNVTFLHYPPAATLWQYFICVNTHYSEGATYFAQFLMLVAPVLILFKNISIKQVSWIILIVSLLIFFLFSLGHGIASLYVDHLLSTLFAGIIIAWMSDHYSPQEAAIFFFPLCVLSLVKVGVGPFFGICAGLFILIHSFILQKRQKQTNASFSNQKNMNRIVFCLLLAAPIIGAGSWNLRLYTMGLLKETQPQMGTYRAVVSISNAVQEPDQDTDYRSVVKNRFFEIFAKQQMSKSKVSYEYNEFSYPIKERYTDTCRLSSLGWILFFIAVVLINYFVIADRDKKKTTLFVSLFLFVVLIAYTGMHLSLYLYAFEQERAVRLVSYVRYANTMLMPLMLVSFSLYLPLLRKNKKTERKNMICLLSFILFLYLVETPYLVPLYSQNPQHKFRESLAEVIPKISQKIESGCSLFVVFPIKENGFLRLMLTYELSPVKTTISSHDILSLSDQDFLKTCMEFDYVYFPVHNQQVNEKVGRILYGKESEINLLYKISREGNQISFTPIM